MVVKKTVNMITHRVSVEKCQAGATSPGRPETQQTGCFGSADNEEADVYGCSG